MQIDYANFTPLASFAGGALIGLSAGLLILLAGRIAGIAGILGGLVNKSPDRTWRALFVLGLLISPWVWQLFAPLPSLTMVTSIPGLIIAGLLVGIGTRYANGCTSGHGICGLSRFSLRSLIAVLAFMSSGFVSVYLIKHIL
ncbi:YeeE/YedE family protein [Deefgea sp. CFH1-16]|uniref:YeeE/YedE family protein n=1 Tax=Deefgea sp. CFH1-16 TaxID=2675457 RepID=UPI0015F726E4|nr:YeeE/YedE thiosulfate transporter family protein [Deefgea sp. CFH1-16]MBM5575428.1 YeeE/YedE family protein [Deefgea sp. CFH1-16]